MNDAERYVLLEKMARRIAVAVTGWSAETRVMKYMPALIGMPNSEAYIVVNDSDLCPLWHKFVDQADAALTEIEENFSISLHESPT